MAKTKDKTPVAPALTQPEIEEQSLELESQSLEEKAKAAFKPDFVRTLKKIAYYTAKVGLPLEEACLLVDYAHDKFQEDMKLEPLISQIIRMKELEYKKDLLYTLSQKARSGDDKLAQWLLSKKYPNEYGEKKSSSPDSTQDIIFEAIRFIRKNGDSTPLIHETSNKPIVIKEADPYLSPSSTTRDAEILPGSSSPSGRPVKKVTIDDLLK